MYSLIAALLYQLPPTPTPLPPVGTPQIVMPTGDGLWESTGPVINLWNMFGTYSYIVQVIVIAAVIFAFIFYIYRKIRAMDEDDTTPQKINVVFREPRRRRRRR